MRLGRNFEATHDVQICINIFQTSHFWKTDQDKLCKHKRNVWICLTNNSVATLSNVWPQQPLINGFHPLGDEFEGGVYKTC